MKELRSLVTWWDAPLFRYHSRSRIVEGTPRIDVYVLELVVEGKWDVLGCIFELWSWSYMFQQSEAMWVSFPHI